MVFSKPPSFPKLVLFLCRLLRKHYRDQKGLQRGQKGLQRSLSNAHSVAPDHKLQNQTSLSRRVSSSKNTTVIFNVEGALLKSSCLFPYFMLVAFEAGSLVRAFVLLALYPLLCFLDHEHSLKVMVMLSFFGLKKKSFRVGSSVLPKYFLEDVGNEVFEVLKRAKVNCAVTDMPQIMVESFLRDYLEIDFVTGRDLKAVCGYYVGLMQDKKNTKSLEDKFEDANVFRNVIGLNNIDASVQHPLFSHCKEVVMVSEVEKLKWTKLSKERYPKPLIFHDGRLAFRPTPLAMLAMFIWFPFGSILSIIRIFIAISLPYKISTPLLEFSGIKLELSRPNNHLVSNTESKTKGSLYVCNHRTLLDPLFLSFGLVKPLAAVTYSLSRMSEFLSPIRTVPLTRNREKDREMMDKLLNQGDLVVCPEGTTCREPYLLRLSPLFTELSDDIVPVGINTNVSMFHGTTASGLKCLDPIFFLMNPTPSYTVQILDKICGVSSCNDDQISRFDVANRVQCELGEALGFECTMLTRKDKYMILAGNEGVVSTEKRQ